MYSRDDLKYGEDSAIGFMQISHHFIAAISFDICWGPRTYFWRLLGTTIICVFPVPVQLLSRVLLFATPWTTARQASLSTTNSQSPPKPESTQT